MAVKLGKVKSVNAVLGDSTQLLIDKAQRGLIESQVALEELVTAPVSRGQRLGTLTITAEGQTLAEVPLVAGEAVERLTWGDLFVMALKRAAMAAQ